MRNQHWKGFSRANTNGKVPPPKPATVRGSSSTAYSKVPSCTSTRILRQPKASPIRQWKENRPSIYWTRLRPWLPTIRRERMCSDWSCWAPERNSFSRHTMIKRWTTGYQELQLCRMSNPRDHPVHRPCLRLDRGMIIRGEASLHWKQKRTYSTSQMLGTQIYVSKVEIPTTHVILVKKCLRHILGHWWMRSKDDT